MRLCQTAPRQLPADGGDARAHPVDHQERGETQIAIAVLPLINLSGDPAQLVLADGISNDMIVALSRCRSLAVTSRGSAFRYRGDIDPISVGRDLKVQYVATGSLRRDAERLRLNIELTDIEFSLNPSNPFAAINRETLLVNLGRHDGAIDWFERAARIDPFFNPSWVQEKLGLAHFTARRYAEAVKHLQQGGRLRFRMHALLAACYASQNRSNMAAAQLGHARAMRPVLRASHVLRLLRYDRPEDRDHLASGLAMAGLT